MPAKKRDREETTQAAAPSKKIKKAKDEADAIPKKSSLVREEVDFPRGGGTELTPLEYKNLRAEAVKEVQDELMFEDSKADKPTGKRHSMKDGLKKHKKQDGEIAEKSDSIRIEHLNYKRLTVGTRLLCQITSIQPLALIVSLPNQLMGHIPITHISSVFTRRLESTSPPDSSDEEGNSDEDEEGKADLPALHDMFSVGQYVRAVVTAVSPSGVSGTLGLNKHGDETQKASRRVELSISPDQVNESISKKDLGPGFNISATVSSLEDHGYILSLGIPNTSAFLSFKEAHKGFDESIKLEVGQVIECSVIKMSDNGRSCSVSVDPSVIKSATISEVSTISSILPGTLVQALITAILPWGLNVQLLAFFQGTLDLFHLPSSDLQKRYKLGQKIRARILWDITTTTPKRFALSVLPHLVALDIPRVSDDKQDLHAVEDMFYTGTIFDQVTVERVESEWGLVCECPNGARGFVHISHVSDEHVPSLSENSGQWRIGSKHRARVIGFSPVDGLLQLSLQQSVIDEKFLQVGDVRVGEIVKGTIKRLSDTGLFVSLSEHVVGVVWPLHFSDIKLKHPERKFKAGATVKCRVLSVDSSRSRITLTLKKTLLDADSSTIVKSFDDAKVGMIVDGVVVKYLPKSILVEYFGGIRALVPMNEMSDVTTNIESTYFLGQVIKTRLISVDLEQSRIVSSIRQVSRSSFQPQPDISSIELGNIVSGAIIAIQKDSNISLDLQGSQVRALLSLSNLATSRGHTVPQLRTSLKPGDILDDLVVVSKNPDKKIVIVAAKKNKPSNDGTSFGKIDHSISLNTLKIGQVVPGRIVSHGGRLGTSVRISNHIVGHVHPTDASDDYTSSSVFPSIQSIVDCAVLEVDQSKKRVLLSARRSLVHPEEESPVLDKEINGLDDLKFGDSVRGFVKSVAEHGLFVSVGRGIDARVQIRELFDEYVKDWKSNFKVNQVVKGRISNINREKNQVEMTFRSGEIKPSSASLRLGDLEVGQKVDGIIKKVEDYGMFVEIRGSKVSGLCHKSEISDDKEGDVAQALKMFREGDKVKVVILSINLEKRKIGFGLKPSYFDAEDFEMGSDDAPDNEGEAEPVSQETNRSEEGDDDDAVEEEDDDDNEESGDEDQEDVVMADPPALHTTPVIATTFAPVLQLSQGFSWSNLVEPNRDGLSDSEESSDEVNAEAAKPKKRKKRHQIEHDLTADMHKKAPESTADFERIILGSPNSSFLWIQYMSFQLQLSEIEKAREIGRRALQTINFREEQEKLNVWIALLNLENAYGTEQTLEAVFKEAASHNDSKTVHLKLATILDQATKLQEAEELYNKIVKKFGSSSKVWTNFGEYYLNHGNLEEARKLLPRSLQSLEKRKHLKTISKFAQLEYKLGESERGRTIFEGIVDSHPKRLDLWSVYIDMEVGQGDVNTVRNVFERVLSQKLSSKKAKFFFKKWLELERTMGDEAGAETVKQKAVEWTQSNARTE